MHCSIITIYKNDIGNISNYENTVMIFCSGIGIAWSMAAIFWAAQGEKFLVPVGRWVSVRNNQIEENPGPLSIFFFINAFVSCLLL
jgi:hypothetical protein